MTDLEVYEFDDHEDLSDYPMTVIEPNGTVHYFGGAEQTSEEWTRDYVWRTYPMFNWTDHIGYTYGSTTSGDAMENILRHFGIK